MIIAGKAFVLNSIIGFSKTVAEETIYDLTGQTLEREFTSNGNEYTSMAWGDPPEDFYFDESLAWNYVTKWNYYNYKLITFANDAADITGDWALWLMDNATEVEPFPPALLTYLADGVDLSSIADTIRLKSGKYEGGIHDTIMVFPDGFKSTIGDILSASEIIGGVEEAGGASEDVHKGATVKFSASAIWGPELTSHSIGANDCAFSPDGKKFVVTYANSPYIDVYNATKIPFKKLTSPTGLPYGYSFKCAFSPDGTRLAIAHDSSPYITVYDATTIPYTKLANPAVLPEGAARCCAFSPDGTRLAVGLGTAPYIAIYDTTTTPFTKLTNHGMSLDGAVTACAFSPNGTRLVVGGTHIAIYNVTTSPYTYVGSPQDPSGSVRDFAFSPDGSKFVVACTSQPGLSAYDTSTAVYTKLSNPGFANSDEGWSCAFSPDGKYLIATVCSLGRYTYGYIYDASGSSYSSVKSQGLSDRYYAYCAFSSLGRIVFTEIGEYLIFSHLPTISNANNAIASGHDYGIALETIEANKTGKVIRILNA